MTGYLDLKIGDTLPPVIRPAGRPFGRSLLAGVQPGDASRDWFVVRCATRQERRAEESLTEAGAVFYVPRLTRWGDHARRRVKVTSALLEGYGFAALPVGLAWHDLERLDGVHQVVRFGLDAPRPVSFRKIAVFARQEVAGLFDRTIKAKAAKPVFEANEAVRIVDGSFTGFSASFVRLPARDRVRVAVSIFGRVVEAELGFDQVEKIA